MKIDSGSDGHDGDMRLKAAKEQATRVKLFQDTANEPIFAHWTYADEPRSSEEALRHHTDSDTFHIGNFLQTTNG
jgi:hypothetical protein